MGEREWVLMLLMFFWNFPSLGPGNGTAERRRESDIRRLRGRGGGRKKAKREGGGRKKAKRERRRKEEGPK